MSSNVHVSGGSNSGNITVRPSNTSNNVTASAGNTSSSVETVNNAAYHWSEVAKDYSEQAGSYATAAATSATLASDILSSVQTAGTEAVSIIDAATEADLTIISNATDDSLDTISSATTSATDSIDVATTNSLSVLSGATDDNIGSIDAKTTESLSIIDATTTASITTINSAKSDAISAITLQEAQTIATLSVYTTSASESATQAGSYATQAGTSATLAGSYATQASTSSTLASDWATKMDGTVDGSEYSAKYYAQQAAQGQVQSNWNETDTDSKAYIQNKPTIGDGATTIQVNGTSIGTITANQTSSGSINISALRNTATNAYSLTIDGITNSRAYGVNIGGHSEAYSNSTAIGYGALAGSYSTSIGNNAVNPSESSIQLGYGENQTSNTFNVGFYNNSNTHYNYQLLDGTTGKIPNARINMDTTVTSASTNAITSGAVYAALGNKQNTLTASTGINIINNSISAIGVKDVRTSNAIKIWTGTKAQYDAIVTKDANTLYNITDDTDVTLTLLEALYPVGSIYIGTMATCPLATLGVGTWQLKTSRFLVDKQEPTDSNPIGWNKYSDGYCEQFWKANSPSTINTTMQLPIAFKDTNYTVIGALADYGDLYICGISTYPATNSTFYAMTAYNGTGYAEPCTWYACGYTSETTQLNQWERIA